MKRVYISGAISGRNKVDYLKEFDAAEDVLRAFGFRPFNPARRLLARWPLYNLFGYRFVLAADIYVLLRCDYIFLLPGWENSKGAKAEKMIADIFGIKAFRDVTIKELVKQ